MKKTITTRAVVEGAAATLSSLPPRLAQIYAARGVNSIDDLARKLSDLFPYHSLRGIDQAVARLVLALNAQQKILIVGDFDADGATSTSVAMLALAMLGAHHVEYLVPNRFEYGYGLTPAIVDVAVKWSPDLIITVDNGISSIEGVDRARELGIDVLVTDHHLAGDSLPKACAIVNPNQPGDNFPSKALAGVGVIYYVMLALRRRLCESGWFEAQGLAQPNMSELLDLVALGTVADVVPLDRNNRVLVHQGLARIRAGKCRPGITALLKVAKRKPERIAASDLGFAVGPRLNAAGRLDDMSLGIECLLSQSSSQALVLAQELDELNHERRNIEAEMQQQALVALSRLKFDQKELPIALCLFDNSWHQGVIGIVAGRIKDKFHRPVIAFADAGDGEIKGSARSIPGLHIRDALDAVAKQQPQLVSKFGGHAMAAGLSLKQADLAAFTHAFQTEVGRHLSEEQCIGEILSDGELNATELSMPFAEMIAAGGPWGQHFPEPIFDNEFELIQQRIVGGKHLKLTLELVGSDIMIDAIYFNVDERAWPNHRAQRVRAAYRLDINEYQGRRSVQLMIEQLDVVS